MIRLLLVATRNPGKLRELNPLFALAGYGVVDPAAAGIARLAAEDALEVFDTFEANALAKARWFSAQAGGMPTVADDSGLEVDALRGRPGVQSKRWAGRTDLSGQALDDANNAYLLNALHGMANRGARYVCAAAFVDDRDALVVRGETRGRILDAPRGGGGFGYDPYFFSNDLRCTFGEAAVAEKAAVSHRGRAFGALIAQLTRRR